MPAFCSISSSVASPGIARWRALNDFTVGIELEGDEIHAYREAQYRSLAAVTKALKLNYPDMNYARITSHARVAPLRKNDPGPAFDWAYFRQCLKALG